MTDKAHDDELSLLHEICDGDIALHSIELAIQVSCDLNYTNLEHKFLFPCEIIIDKSRWQTLLPSARVLHNLGMDLQERFENLGHISDLEKAIAMHRKAIISTPLNSADRPLMFSNLGASYLCRFKRFGDVKDIDSAIRQQFKAVASISPDSEDRPAIFTNFGNACLSRFERFKERKDIDSAVELYLKAAASIPLESVHRPGILRNLGNSYQRRFEWLGDIQDLESAIKHRIETAASIPLTDLGSSTNWELHISFVLIDLERRRTLILPSSNSSKQLLPLHLTALPEQDTSLI